MDREKVIKGLECCVTMPDIYPRCEECPYADAEGTCANLNGLHRDALALLKAQEQEVVNLTTKVAELQTFVREPRVMTLEDVIMADFVWLEADDTIRTAIRTPGHPDYICFGVYFGAHVHDVIVRRTNYGKTFRCWTSCPTDEQRKAVEWE